jgi:hypothetical protein
MKLSPYIVSTQMHPEVAIIMRIGPERVPVIVATCTDPALVRPVIGSALADAQSRAAVADISKRADTYQQVQLLTALSM